MNDDYNKQAMLRMGMAYEVKKAEIDAKYQQSLIETTVNQEYIRQLNRRLSDEQEMKLYANLMGFNIK